MKGPERWIATVSSKGEVEAVRRYEGYADDGCVTPSSTYGTRGDVSYQAIAGTREAAIEAALECWKQGQD